MENINSHDGDGTLDAAVTNSVSDHHPGLAYTFGRPHVLGHSDRRRRRGRGRDGVRIEFDGSGQLDAVAWDSDGDGTVDPILVSSHHDGHYDTAYYDHGDRGSWNTAEDVAMTLRQPGDADAHAATLSYSFGDPTTPTQTYSGVADTDIDGEGTNDGIALDFDGSGHKDAVGWDSDGDGKIDTILVSSHHDQ